MVRLVCLTCVVAGLVPAGAADADRDFSGKWFLDAKLSDVRALGRQPDEVLLIAQAEGKIRISAASVNGLVLQGVYTLDGSENAYDAGQEKRNSAVKWEGDALLINTLVSGAANYVIEDRWKLSGDRGTLTIGRVIRSGRTETEGKLVYRREGRTVTAAPSLSPRPEPARAAVRAPANPPAGEYTVRSGTHILLTLVNSVNTKHSHAGDRIYLQTAFPVAVNDRVVIPRGASVSGTVTDTKRPGRAAGKGELYIRFDSLTLPNGVTRDFRSRLGNAETAGSVDRDEGKITGPGNKSGDARTIAEGAGMGASVGGIAGAASGNAGKGLGVGGAAGAAAGLATVLLKRGPDVVLQKGTRVEMVLDRDLVYQAEELRR